MIWLVWRQHRLQALFALAGLAVLAAVLVPTGLQMRGELARTGLDRCLPSAGRVEFLDSGEAPDPSSAQVSACQERAERFTGRFGNLDKAGIVLWFLPLLAGLFWGAPLIAREVEHGTHRLVWTQGVSRRRWALAKFGLVGGGVIVVATCYALLVTWWHAPLDQASGHQFDYFGMEGLVPVGYTLLAVALGVLAGALTRKSQPAMAITLVGFLAVRLLLELVARQRYLAPLERAFPVVGTREPNRLTGDWVLSQGIYDAQGNLLAGGGSGPFGSGAGGLCPPPCKDLGHYNLELIHPAERFWLFQGIETAICVVAAVVLLAAALRWTRRRIT